MQTTRHDTGVTPIMSAERKYTPEQRAAQITMSNQLETMIERYIDTMIDGCDPDECASTKCQYCRGSGSVPGDWVPYGDTNVQTPSTICECVFEGARERVDELLESGGLQLAE